MATEEMEYKEGFLPEYRYGSDKKGRVVVAVFPDRPSDASEAAVEAKKIEVPFMRMGYEPLDLSHDMKKIKKKKFMELLNEIVHDPGSESLIVIVVCALREGKLRLPSGETLEMEDVYQAFDAEKCRELLSKPKIFVLSTHPYLLPVNPKHHTAHPSGYFKPGNFNPVSVTVPLQADMLVVYSHEEKPRRPFVDILAECLESNFEKGSECNDILEVMVDVTKRVMLQNGQDKHIPIVVSTLNSPYYIKKNIKS